MPANLVDVLLAQGVDEPFAIQARTIPDALAGRDILGCGETGSGKTYAFLIPLVARLSATAKVSRNGGPRALILAPTRELATQIAAALAPLARAASLTSLTVFGGTAAQPQIKALRRGVDIVVACPGRLDDHVRSGHGHLGNVEITVIDEADHMADLGFLPVVKRLLDATPRRGQRLLFSATLDRAVDALTKRYLTNPASHQVAKSRPVDSTAVVHHVLHVDQDARLPVLVDLTSAPGRALVFSRTRRGTKRLAKQLTASGVRAVELHGDLSQGQRTRNLALFMRGDVHTLVATDIAARGIHVDDIALVIHADPPAEHKAYVHRSGRTARAGANGTVVTLATASQLKDVRTLTKRAGVQPIVSQVAVGSPRLEEIAPGHRALSRSLPDREPANTPRRSGRRPAAPGKSRQPTRAQPRHQPSAAASTATAFSRSQRQPSSTRRTRRRLAGVA